MDKLTKLLTCSVMSILPCNMFHHTGPQHVYIIESLEPMDDDHMQIKLGA